MIDLILFSNISILIYYSLLSLWYTVILFLAFPDVIRTFRETQYGNLDRIMTQCSVPITIIMPAYNEETRILDALIAILNNDYKNTKLIVVNDGSEDNTLELLINEFSLYEIPPVIKETIKTAPIRHLYQSKRHKNLVVIDKEHSPRNNAADANNAGLNATSTPLVVTVDADTVLESDAIMNILYEFLSHKHCVSIGGTVYVLNSNKVYHGRIINRHLPKGTIPAIQSIEYFRAFTFGRAGLNGLSGALSYAGAFTLFETKAVREFGGFDTDNFAYDAEVILKFHHKMRHLKYPTKVRFSSNAAAWTLVPSTFRQYWNQRNHWQRGMLRSVFRHKSMFFNPKYGIVGLLTFPCYVLFEVFGSVIEFVSYLLLIIGLMMNVVSWYVVAWFLFLAWGYMVLSTIGAFYLSLVTFNTYYRFFDLIRVIALITIEMFGFRQVRAACCFWGTLQFMWNRLLGRPI